MSSAILGCPGCLHKRFQGLSLQQSRQSAPRAQKAVVRAVSTTKSASLPLRDVSGADKGTSELELRVASNNTAKGLVHRYLVMARQNGRAGTASTKTRAEVRGGGKKPYSQKGSGNARQGSKRTPLRPGGGVVFGPKPKDWSIRMNKKERRLALATALQSAAGSTVVVSNLAEPFEAGPKTKTMVDTLASVGASPEEYTLLVLNEPNDNVMRSARNVKKLEVNYASALRIYDVLRADRIVMEADALQFIQEFYPKA